MAEKNARKLRAQSSHPDAPRRKTAANSSGNDHPVPSSGEDMSDDAEAENVQGMFKEMMRMMEANNKKIDEVKDSVAESLKTAEKAVSTVDKAVSAVIDLKASMKDELGRLDGKVVKLAADSAETKAKIASLEAEVDKIISNSHDFSAGGGGKGGGGGGKGNGKGKGGGKDTGKDAKKRDERKRTVKFSNFPDDTQEDEIIASIRDRLKNVSNDDIQEVYAYARTGTRGAARFVSEDSMWKYLTDNKGKHHHEHDGRRIYIQACTEWTSSDDDLKDKAVRKAVRALIERDGRPGDVVKENLDIKYPWGAVWTKGENKKWEKVAQWNAQERTMQMLGTAATLQETVDKLME